MRAWQREEAGSEAIYGSVVRWIDHVKGIHSQLKYTFLPLAIKTSGCQLAQWVTPKHSVVNRHRTTAEIAPTVKFLCSHRQDSQS